MIWHVLLIELEVVERRYFEQVHCTVAARHGEEWTIAVECDRCDGGTVQCTATECEFFVETRIDRTHFDHRALHWKRLGSRHRLRIKIRAKTSYSFRGRGNDAVIRTELDEAQRSFVDALYHAGYFERVSIVEHEISLRGVAGEREQRLCLTILWISVGQCHHTCNTR